MRPQILTKSGNYFNFLEPVKNKYDITDIAHGLSHVCRFGGQCRKFYSVAQHSVYVSYLVPKEFQFDALMHDAAEAFLGDIPKPLKILLPDYQVIEKRVEADLFSRFGVSFPLAQCIKDADAIMLATEQRDLMPANDDDWAEKAGIKPWSYKFRPLSSLHAYNLFMQRYEELQPTRRAVIG